MFEDMAPKPTAVERLRSTKVPLWAALLLFILLIGVAASRQAAVSEAERDVAAARQEADRKLQSERIAAEARAREALMQQSERGYRLFGSALTWAIRGALVRNDVREVDQYFAELVKNQPIKLALLANAKGRIVASSDKQFLGKSFGEHFAPALLKTDAISLGAQGDDKLLVVPIRGLTSRLGTAVVTYTVP